MLAITGKSQAIERGFSCAPTTGCGANAFEEFEKTILLGRQNSPDLTPGMV
jgi:hypothetical protein